MDIVAEIIPKLKDAILAFAILIDGVALVIAFGVIIRIILLRM
jgi:hypothetical protein